MPVIKREHSKNLDFNVWRGNDGWSAEWMAASVLQDIRDELQKLNTLLHCSNFTTLPATVRSIRRAMPAKKKRGAR